MTRHLLAVLAHPDDESFGLGATLARYAREGVAVHVAIATRGEAGSVPPEMRARYASTADMRWAELECAARELRLAGLHWLGFRDSGMEGSEDNRHPEALVNAPIEAVAERIVALIREVRPQVVITHDPIGGYRHPDHIHLHKAGALAFRAAGDPTQYPDAGPAFRPQKLYYEIFPHRLLTWLVRLSPLLGINPRQFGRNRDIDLTQLVNVEFPIHVRLRVGDYAAVQDRASQCHASQLASGPPRNGLIGLIFRLGRGYDYFMRAEPPAPEGLRERDLFEGIADRSTSNVER